MPQLGRSTQDPQVMGGKALRPRHARDGGLGRPDAAGHSIEEVLAEYPYLERQDVLQALRCAAWLAEDCEVALPRA